jgi:hypothetical protein
MWRGQEAAPATGVPISRLAVSYPQRHGMTDQVHIAGGARITVGLSTVGPPPDQQHPRAGETQHHAHSSVLAAPFRAQHIDPEVTRTGRVGDHRMWVTAPSLPSGLLAAASSSPPGRAAERIHPLAITAPDFRNTMRAEPVRRRSGTAQRLLIWAHCHVADQAVLWSQRSGCRSVPTLQAAKCSSCQAREGGQGCRKRIAGRPVKNARRVMSQGVTTQHRSPSGGGIRVPWQRPGAQIICRGQNGVRSCHPPQWPSQGRPWHRALGCPPVGQLIAGVSLQRLQHPGGWWTQTASAAQSGQPSSSESVAIR